MEIKIKKLKDVELPKKHYEGDLGWDLFLPYDIEEIRLSPGQIAKIPIGIATELPEGFGAVIRDRSSMASRGLHILGGEIDNRYRGEWHLLMINLSPYEQVLRPGERIAQFRLTKVYEADISETDSLSNTDRGAGGFESAGR